jgi:predicted flap endonuclease-1-like 5' DNA nuclease
MPTDYTLMDATLEIFLMLLAAFLLGWFFCWLMKKLFGSKSKTVRKQPLNVDDTTIKKPEGTGIISSNRERMYNSDTDFDSEINAPEIDTPEINLNEVDLPKQAKVKTPDLDIPEPAVTTPRPRIDLPDFNTPDLGIDDKLASGKASLGKGLGMATAGIGAVAVGASSFKDKVVDKAEGLTSDISVPDMPDLSLDTPDLPDLSINTPEPLSVNTEIDLPDLDVSSNFEKEIDLPEVDSKSFETEIDLPEIPDIQATADSIEVETSSSSAGIAAVGTGAAAIQANDSIEKPTTNIDDLSKITGIDNQVTRVLNDRGIHSYQDLQATNRTQLKEYLDSTGDSKLREIEPASWPHQATLCANGNWSKLTEYQSFLTGSNLGIRQDTPSEGTTSIDDLKKVEGIGPFFESLLNDAGITTYEQLKNSDRDTLKEIIDAAGPDYRMHEPETWPYQAGLAYRGEWKKLQDYIHFMTGRS